MGLRADILKPSYGECSNGGISSRADQVTIVNVGGPFDPTDDAPAVMLIYGNVPGTVKLVGANHVHGDVWIEQGPPGMCGPMMGGCYVASADVRLQEAVEALTGRLAEAVPLHDRFETAKQAAELSV